MLLRCVVLYQKYSILCRKRSYGDEVTIFDLEERTFMKKNEKIVLQIPEGM
jgi:hypothetical protein